MGRDQGRQEGQRRAWRRAQGANAKGEGRKRAQKGPEEGESKPSEHHVTSVCLIIAAVIGFFSCYHCFLFGRCIGFFEMLYCFLQAPGTKAQGQTIQGPNGLGKRPEKPRKGARRAQESPGRDQ